MTYWGTISEIYIKSVQYYETQTSNTALYSGLSNMPDNFIRNYQTLQLRLPVSSIELQLQNEYKIKGAFQTKSLILSFYFDLFYLLNQTNFERATSFKDLPLNLAKG